MAHPTADPRKLPRQRRSRETVDRILAAAARIFDEVGYEATTTNDVAAHAHVSIGSLYQYFPNKDALLVALAERHVEEAVKVLGADLDGLRRVRPSTPDVVRHLVERTVALNDTDALHALMHAQAVRTPALRARFERLIDVVVAGVVDLLPPAPGHDPTTRARLLVAACDAAVHGVVLRNPPGPGRRAAVDALVNLLVDGLDVRVTPRPDSGRAAGAADT